MSKYNRREFLKIMGCYSAAMVGSSVFLPQWFTRSAEAQAAPRIRNVLHLYLSGGFDGMFLVGPYGDDFKAVRKDLYFDPGNATASLFTNSGGRDLYMHSALNTFFRDAWNRNELLIVAGAGVPVGASGSHEDATKMIAAGVYDGRSDANIPFEQRLASLNASQFPNNLAYIDLSGGNTLSKPTGIYKCLSGSLSTFGFNANLATAENKFRLGSFFSANRNDGLSTMQLAAKENWSVVESSVSQVTEAVNSTTINPVFPNTGIGRQLREAFIAFTRLGTRAAGAVAGGYDTHANELVDLPANFGQVAAALNAFYLNMVRVGAWNDCAVVINSEFGRNIKMNATKGCDHGVGNTHFITGGAIKGGMLGAEIFTTDNINSRRNAWPVVNPVAAYYKAIGQGMGLDVSRAFPDFSGAALDLLK